MPVPSILEDNQLRNAPDWELRYRETEARLKAERPDLWEHVLEMRGPVGEQPIDVYRDQAIELIELRSTIELLRELLNEAGA